MKLKTYSAQTMAEAMETAKAELGEDALIVSSVRDGLGSGIKITVAVDDDDISDKEIEDALFGSSLDHKGEKVKEVLDYHGIPEVLSERILTLAAKSQTVRAEDALVQALGDIFSFKPLEFTEVNKVYMLVGTAGCGKSTAAAKLATEARLAGLIPAIISTDSYRAGADEQLKAFTKILEADLITAKKPEELANAIKKARKSCDILYIDTASINPFEEADLVKVSELIGAYKDIEAVLVVEAGGNVEESVERFSIFSESGIGKFMTTKLDISKRIGGIIAGAYHSGMKFYGASFSHDIAGSLKSVDAAMLGKLLLPLEFTRKEPAK